MFSKKFLILTFMIISIVIASYVTMFGYNVFTDKVSIIFGGILIIFAIIFQILGEVTEVFYYVASIVNSISIGLFISEFYHVVDSLPNTEMFILSMGICIMVLVVYMILRKLLPLKKDLIMVNVIFIVSLYIITIYLWVTYKTNMFSLLFFMMHFVYFNIILLSVDIDDNKDFYKKLSLCYFGVAMVIGGIVLIIVSEGEALGGLDGIGFAGGNKNKKSHM